MGAPNSLNLNCKVRVMKEAPDPSVSEEIADIFTNYNIDNYIISSTTMLVVTPSAFIFPGQGTDVLDATSCVNVCESSMVWQFVLSSLVVTRFMGEFFHFIFKWIYALLFSLLYCVGVTSGHAIVWLNSSPPSAAYTHQWTGSALVQVMKQCWLIVNWTHRNKFKWNSNQNSCISIQEKCSWNCRLPKW